MADIAGLVLGAIPLVIAAIEHYQTCFEALRCWQEFQDEHRKCIRRILHFEVQFEFLLVRLFGNHVEGRTELDLLKAGYRSKSWDDVELILEVRLGRAVYRLFCETLRDVCKAVEGLKTVLQIDDKTLLDPENPVHTATFAAAAQTTVGRDQGMSKLKPIARKWQADLRYESQRFHFVRRRTEREKSLDQIETLMDGLRQILIDHEEIARRWPQLRAQREIPVLYEHAQNVFRLVESVWRCQCASKHCADLRLHHLEHNLVQFDILFRYGETKQRYQQAPWILHETTVEEVTEREEAAVRAPSSRPANFTSVPIPSPPAKAQAGQPSPVSFSYKGRRRANCAGPSGSATKILTQTPIPLVTLPILPQPPDPIDDLCEAISRHSFTPCAGVLAPIRERDIKYKLSACTLGIQRNEETCKLESLLSSTSELTSRKQRYGIALAITSSHLQIHPSPWLGRIWSSEDIHFYMKNGVLELSRPYLRRKFTPADPTEPPRGCRDDTFGSLGILLLELFFNIPLAKSPHRQKYQSPDGKPDFVMDMAAAQMWADVDMEKGNIEKEYAGAVLWCLKKRTLRPQDESTWRQKLHRKVVLPIQNVYEALA